MARKTIRIEIPISKPEDLLKLVQSVIDKNKADGTNSQLANITKISLTNMETQAKNAAALRKEAEDLVNQARTKYQQAETLLGISEGQTIETKDTIYSDLAYIRDFLLVENKGNEEKLGEYGYNVVIGKAKSPTRKPKTSTGK